MLVMLEYVYTSGFCGFYFDVFILLNRGDSSLLMRMGDSLQESTICKQRRDMISNPATATYPNFNLCEYFTLGVIMLINLCW